MLISNFHEFQEVVKPDFNDERLQRSPTFTTSSGEESNHDSAITGLKPLPEVSSTLEGGYGDTFQIVSCEELGKVIIWTVLDSLRDSDVHLGLAHWGCVRIVNSVQMDLECVSSQDVIFGPRKSKTVVDASATSESGNGSDSGDLFVVSLSPLEFILAFCYFLGTFKSIVPTRNDSNLYLLLVFLIKLIKQFI